MRKEDLKIGSTVSIGNGVLILVLSNVSGFWFKGRMISIGDRSEDEFHYVGYESDFNIDFAKQV